MIRTLARERRDGGPARRAVLRLRRSLADQYLVMERGEIIARGRGADMDARRRAATARGMIGPMHVADPVHGRIAAGSAELALDFERARRPHRARANAATTGRSWCRSRSIPRATRVVPRDRPAPAGRHRRRRRAAISTSRVGAQRARAPHHAGRRQVVPLDRPRGRGSALASTSARRAARMAAAGNDRLRRRARADRAPTSSSHGDARYHRLGHRCASAAPRPASASRAATAAADAASCATAGCSGSSAARIDGGGALLDSPVGLAGAPCSARCVAARGAVDARRWSSAAGELAPTTARRAVTLTAGPAGRALLGDSSEAARAATSQRCGDALRPALAGRAGGDRRASGAHER